MSDPTNATFFSRIGSWFKRSDENGEAFGMEPEQTLIEPRSIFLRPWARRDAAIQNLQDGFNTLTDLMGAIRDGLEKQNRRQDELVGYLSHLPEALQGIPESNRVQSETLKAIHQQIQHQNEQQKAVTDILGRISHGEGAQREALEELRERMETLNQYDQAIADHLRNVGSAMQSVSVNSQTSAQVLDRMRENINSRDGELERILQRQNTRFTTMLAIAIFLSIAALAAVSTIGYLQLMRP